MPEVYLDNSATTTVDPQVAQKIYDVMTVGYGNPSSLHKRGFQAQLELDKSREIIADILDCRADEIVFTGSGSEANNLAIHGVAKANARRKGSLVVSAAEHSSVLNAFKELEKQGWKLDIINPLSDGTPDIDALVGAVGEDTLLVSAMLVNSETGAICDVKSLASRVKRKNPSTYLHCDAVQGFCRQVVFPGLWGIDLLSVSGHKINGPKGVGALYIRKGVRLLPLYYGGGQEKGLRPGTENVASISGFALAAEQMFSQRKAILDRFEQLRRKLLEDCKKVQGICINSPQNGAPYIMNISLPGLRSETIIHFLEARDIYISSGSACSKGAKSPVLTSMGLDDARIDSALRISFGKYNTADDIDALIAGLIEARNTLASREEKR